MYSQICEYIQNMEWVAAVINIQSDMYVYTEYGEGRAVINVKSDMCVHTEYRDGSSGN